MRERTSDALSIHPACRRDLVIPWRCWRTGKDGPSIVIDLRQQVLPRNVRVFILGSIHARDFSGIITHAEQLTG